MPYALTPLKPSRQIPQIIYKFTYQKYLDSYLCGKDFYLGTLDKYRTLDNKGIGDKLEATNVLESGNIDLNSLPDYQKRIAQKNIRENFKISAEALFNPGSIFVGNRLETRLANCPIFCASTVFNNDVVEKLKIDAINNDEAPYDTVIPIQRISDFSHAIAMALNPTGCPVALGYVDYLPTTFSLLESFPRPDPFVKRPEFSAQAEYRLKFEVVLNDNVECQIIQPKFTRGTFGNIIKLT